MTSRRAQKRRARERAAITTAPGRELERRPVRSQLLTSEDLEAFTRLERRVAAELERGLASGDLGPYAEVFGQLLEHPVAEQIAGIGTTQWHHAERAPVPPGVHPELPPGAGMPKSCYELALRFVADHAELPGLRLVHGLVFEPKDEPMPGYHAWVTLDGDTMWDPTTATTYVASSFYEVLGVVAATAYTPAEALEQWAATGSAKTWPRTLAAHARLIDGWITEMRRQSPELAGFIAGMLECDERFRAEYEALARRAQLLLVHVWADLLRHPERWEGHVPGEPWAYALHPGTAIR